MNTPPSTYRAVPYQDLQVFVSAAGQAVGMPENQADLLAELLVANDLRGVFSHGSQQIAGYARQMRDGQLNPAPEVAIVHETPTSLLADGDGGLGYFPAHAGTLRIIEKAQEQGIAILVTRNHGHFGAAGLYSRMTLPYDLLSFVTSGHQLGIRPGQPVANAGGGSPMSFSVPTNDDPIVLDYGTTVDLYHGSPHFDELARMVPGLVLRSIGQGIICQSWGGLLAGVPLNPERAQRAWPGANQGSMVIAFQIGLFLPPEQFKRETTEYARIAREMTPIPGQNAARLPGGLEAERDRAYRRDGIPIGTHHQERLEALAKELSLSVPWSD
jgi:LDH2 family malate/lactate/ureidoglycolate dehydrogenase